MRPFLRSSAQSMSALCPPTCTKSRTGGDAKNRHGHVHTWRQTQRARRPAHAETVNVRKDVCALTDHGDTCTLEPQTRPGCLPHAHLQEGFPARCSSHAPNKSQLIRTLPLNRSPPLGFDQISTRGRKRKSPLFLLLRFLLRCCSAQRGCLRALPPPNHAADHRPGDRPLLQFGFQSGGAAASGSLAGAPTPASDGPLGASV